MKKYKVGYTSGVYDMFHVGHLNILKKAKEQCEYLIVGVTTDELALYKNAKVIIPFEDRCAIVESIKYVDKVIPQETMEKMVAWKKEHFDVIFVGDDWKGTEKWKKLEQEFAKVGVDIVYFPYTAKISSSKLREIIKELQN